jgi:hypothetical protein
VHVAGDIEPVVVDPLLTVDAPAEPRQSVQARVHVATQGCNGGSRPLELQRPADVQGRLSGLEVKEG